VREKIKQSQKDRKTERQKDRKTERQKDRKTERQKDRKTERQKDRKTQSQKDKETGRQTNPCPHSRLVVVARVLRLKVKEASTDGRDSINHSSNVSR
jgi:hypothetical protein